MASKNIYDMMRAKAKSMGHAAANLPDSVWQKYLDVRDERTTLWEAKFYMEDYMMGTLAPSELAQLMAKDDNLRHTISDLCSMRLEPVNLDIQRNDNYIDVGAGVKTFWTEIRVPLPSELDAARDIRNINYGIEAGQNAAGIRPASQGAEAVNVEEVPPKKKRTFSEVLSDARRKLAERAIEKLTPLTEDKDDKQDRQEKEPQKLDESWFETEEGREYHDAYTRAAAQQVENVVMDIEAGKYMGLHPEERKNAYRAAEVPEETIHELVLDSDYHEYSRLIDEYLDSTGADIGDINLTVMVSPEEELFTEEDMAAIGSGEETNEEAAADIPDERRPLRSGYSEDALNAPLDDDMQALFDQIMQHVNQDRTARQKGSQNENGSSKDNAQHKREGYVNGIFEGREVSFKGSWSGHDFTKEETDKLLAGETISFAYTDKKDRERTVSGKLEWQEYNGREFLGFKADYSRKNDRDSAKETDQDTHESGMAAAKETDRDIHENETETLFDASDEALMNYCMGGGEVEPGTADDFADDYYSRLTDELDYHGGDLSYVVQESEEEVIELSAEDCAILFEDTNQAMSM